MEEPPNYQEQAPSPGHSRTDPGLQHDGHVDGLRLLLSGTAAAGEFVGAGSGGGWGVSKRRAMVIGEESMEFWTTRFPLKDSGKKKPLEENPCFQDPLTPPFGW